MWDDSLYIMEPSNVNTKGQFDYNISSHFKVPFTEPLNLGRDWVLELSEFFLPKFSCNFFYQAYMLFFPIKKLLFFIW